MTSARAKSDQQKQKSILVQKRMIITTVAALFVVTALCWKGFG